MRACVVYIAGLPNLAPDVMLLYSVNMLSNNYYVILMASESFRSE